MIKRLDGHGLLRRLPGHRVELTEHGMAHALGVVRRHRAGGVNVQRPQRSDDGCRRGNDIESRWSGRGPRTPPKSSSTDRAESSDAPGPTPPFASPHASECAVRVLEREWWHGSVSVDPVARTRSWAARCRDQARAPDSPDGAPLCGAGKVALAVSTPVSCPTRPTGAGFWRHSAVTILHSSRHCRGRARAEYGRWPGCAVGYRPRRPIGLPSASASTHTRASGVRFPP